MSRSDLHLREGNELYILEGEVLKNACTYLQMPWRLFHYEQW